jgi:hypothetical protein
MAAVVIETQGATARPPATSIVDWGAVFAGAVLATAVALILLTFGAGLGLSVTSPYEGEGANPALYAIGAGLWMLWVQLVSFSIAGYVTARLRARRGDATDHEVDVRDGLHGLLAWGVGVIAAALISLATLGSAGGAAAATEDAPRGVAASVAEAASAEIADAASGETAANPEARDESAAERQAEIARKLTVLAAFITAASMLAGAAAAFFSAGFGGKHRDRNTQLKFFTLR